MKHISSFSALWVAGCLLIASAGVRAQQPAAPQTTPAQPPTSAQAPAQPPAEPGQGETGPIQTLRIGTNLVNLVFTVTDKNGRFVTGLQRGDFGLLDDGRPPEKVIEFHQQTNLPLRIGIMLDTSSSIRTRFHFEQEAALDFFRQVLHANDRAFIEGFDIEISRPQDYTSNIALLDAGIEKLRPGGGTALYDSLYRTCRDEMLTLRDTTPTRKAIILVSDGDDNYSRSDVTTAIKMCQRAETIVYAISTDDSPSRGKGGDVLQQIATATGGQVFFPKRVEEVSNGFRNIEEELRSQYSLEYQPANFRTDGSFRSIYLQSISRKYFVRAKKGYFATRAGAPGDTTPPTPLHPDAVTSTPPKPKTAPPQ